MKNTAVILAIIACMLTAMLPQNASYQNPVSDNHTDLPVFGFDLSARELAEKGNEIYVIAAAWNRDSVPQQLGEFPLFPADLFRLAEEAEALTPVLAIEGRKAIWRSGAEDLYSGDYGTVIRDTCFGWTDSGKEIDFTESSPGTYESLFFQDASGVNYVRQQRAWSNGGWEYNFSIDFYEAGEEHGGRIANIEMLNPETGMIISWQIDTENSDVLMVGIWFNDETYDKVITLEYDLKTGALTGCEIQ